MDESVLYNLKNLNDRNIILVNKNQFKIGRALTNDLVIINNRYISSCHCIIEFNNGHIYIRDTSSNGTLINRTKKLHKNESPIELQSGDIIHLVFRKDEPESNVIFQLNLSPIINQNEQKLKRKYSNTSSNEMKENIDMEMKRIKTKEELFLKAGDDMEDVLTCVCCQDIMTNPICLEPCLHAFCNDCYASWEVIQHTCPKCRVKVIGKKKNVVINGILEAYLKAYPHKQPILKTIDNTNSKIKITMDTKTKIDSDRTYINLIDEEDEEKEAMDDHFVVVMASPVPSDVRFICRQCPSANKINENIISTEFQCKTRQNHILCQCCVQPMPDRQDEANIHQSCEICHQYFCNIYFQQCQRQDCLGCLNQLRNFNFAPRHLVNFVNDNPIETQIVQNYLTAHHATVRELLIECCQRLDRKEFTCTDIDRNVVVPSKKIVCYKCGLNIFKQLAYQFRVSMKPNDILPIIMRNREDCYYGKQCRTQYTKAGHAQKLNHACEQTKF